jgi:hypothetical protein
MRTACQQRERAERERKRISGCILSKPFVPLEALGWTPFCPLKATFVTFISTVKALDLEEL